MAIETSEEVLRRQIVALEQRLRAAENRAMPQLWFTVADLAAFFRFSETTIRQYIRNGRFGPQEAMLMVGTDLRVPWSGYDFFVRNNPFNYSNAVKARNKEELQRKLKGKELVQS